MEDEIIDEPYDSVSDRAQAIRNIAADLETIKNKDSRRILLAAADAVLKHLTPPTAKVLTIAPKSPAKGDAL